MIIWDRPVHLVYIELNVYIYAYSCIFVQTGRAAFLILLETPSISALFQVNQDSWGAEITRWESQMRCSFVLVEDF